METLKQLVKEEADKLKQHATKEELESLSFEGLNPESEETCIYGLMTGNCFSERAHTLLQQCTVPFSEHLSAFEEPESCLFLDRHVRAFSPIEYYILQQAAKNDNLIAYIKGETKSLEL